eukprot:scaffold474787_cov49-Prasinocladus_malaysianus.AAC.2
MESYSNDPNKINTDAVVERIRAKVVPVVLDARAVGCLVRAKPWIALRATHRGAVLLAVAVVRVVLAPRGYVVRSRAEGREEKAALHRLSEANPPAEGCHSHRHDLVSDPICGLPGSQLVVV